MLLDEAVLVDTSAAHKTIRRSMYLPVLPSVILCNENEITKGTFSSKHIATPENDYNTYRTTEIA
jgi:hypothetical protein